MTANTIALVASILLGFVLMTRGWLRQEVAMPLLALVAVILAGPVEGLTALERGFGEFARIAVLFTAVAVPAHQLQRSRWLDWIGLWIGELVGRAKTRTGIGEVYLVPAFSLVMVYVMAALFHNTTSILVGSGIVYVICRSYGLPALPVLAPSLVASNLGGFSTRWGDTPNIIESATWGLSHLDFFREITPLNVTSVGWLVLVSALWLRLSTRKSRPPNGAEIAKVVVDFRAARRELDKKHGLALVGVAGLVLAIAGPLQFPNDELMFSALAILVSVIGDYSWHRAEALFVLGTETYGTLAAIFVLAQVLANSSIGIGAAIQQWLLQSGMSIWAIASASYLGTLLTEAASWASAAAPLVHAQMSTHAAAWALGAGIFAGSSSLVTAASAGIILSQETRRNPASAWVTFGSYVLFGLCFSLFMLGYYIVVLTLMFR